MTSPLRRKRPITVRAASRAARTICSLLVLLLAGVALGQQPYPSSGSTYDGWQPAPVETTTPRRVQAIATARQREMPGDRGTVPDQDHPAVHIQTEPPDLPRLALSVQSDAQLQARIRQEERDQGIPERGFPTDPVLSTDTYNGRKWYPMRLEVAPYYVCHGRLYFQQINFERYGWDLGILTPFISGARFLYDFVAFPYHLAKEPCRGFEYNTGWCLPGDPVPLLLYPLQVSATGFVAEVGTIITLVACFP